MNYCPQRTRTLAGRKHAVAVGALAAHSSIVAAGPFGATAFQGARSSHATFLCSSSKQAPKIKRPVLAKAPTQQDDDLHQHIDLQSDASQYGRGEEHITFDLQPGDVVAYQRGTWYVDGVAVGPGDDPCWSYALVDGLQVVWTHNCEHGVVRGWNLDLVHCDDNEDDVSTGTTLRRNGEEEEVEFGPEQVIGRINNMQWDDDMMIGIAPIPLNDDIWRRAAEEQY